MGSSRDEGNEDLEVAEVTSLLDSLHFDHLREVLGDIRSMNLRVVRIIPVGLLEPKCQVFELGLSHAAAFLRYTFPIEFIVAIHKLEVEQVLVDGLVDQVGVVVVLQEVLVVGLELGAV